MAEKFSNSSLHRPRDGDKFNYTYRPSEGDSETAVIRCTLCNKFLSWPKYQKNNYTCYHCGDKS